MARAGRNRSDGARVVVRGGTVWTEEGGRPADILVDGGKVVGLGEVGEEGGGATVIDATGLDVLPGMIDVHVHLDDRIGRYPIADDFTSGSEVAVRNGVTTLATFVTQRPDETLTQAVGRLKAKGVGRSFCDYVLHLTPTGWPWDWDEVADLVADGYRTFKLYTTYRDAGLHSSYERLAEVMPRLALLGARLLVHCEDDDILAGITPTWVNLRDPASHGCLRPPSAELKAVRWLLELAESSGCPTHVVHVSVAAAIQDIAAVRERAVVTCETAPQYLLLDDSSLERDDGHRFFCTPPLRSAAVREKLEEAAAAGGVDLFATDHCPFLRRNKDSWSDDFRAVPNGLPGVGALLPLVHELLVTRHGRGLDSLVRHVAANPARLLGLFPEKGTIQVGADADLVILDSNGPEREVVPTLADAYNPYAGRTTKLSVRWALVGGLVVVRDGDLAGDRKPRGRHLRVHGRLV